MKILIITQYFPPEVGAPQARLYELAVRLMEKGHEVTVLTAMPNYPTGRVFDAYRGKWRLIEDIDGIKVVRTALFASKSARTIPRLLSYLSFALSSVGLGIWGLGRHDVAVVESPPLFMAPSGWLVSKVVRAKPVFMVSDIWPDIIVRMGYATGRLNLKAMLWLERWAYRHYKVVALTNPGAMNQIAARFPDVKTTVISNGVDTAFFSPRFRSESIREALGASPETFLVGYCGLHGLAQGLEAVVDAARLLDARSDIQMVMIGDGPVKDDLRQRADALGVSNLRFLERRPKSEMPAVLASCDAMLVPLNARMPGTMPSKVYEALAAGTPPIVAKGCEGDTLISEFGCGVTFEPLDGNELATAILSLADDRSGLQRMSERCVDLAKRFDRDEIANRTARILEAIAADEPTPEVTW